MTRLTGRGNLIVGWMRIPPVALLIILGLPPCTGADPSRGATGHLVVENESTVDVAFELADGGARVPGCFWALRGRTTTFELPRGRLHWSYAMAGTHFSGVADLTTGLRRMLRCETTQARLGGDIASCEPAPPPETPPPDDATAALAGSALGFLEQLARDVEHENLAALGASIEAPLDVEWDGEAPGTRRVKHARHLLEVREHLGLDQKALAAAKARSADLRTGEADCDKQAIDWSKGGPALTCEGREVSVTLAAGSACGKTRQMSTWRLRNASQGWQLAGKSVTVVR